MPVTAADLERLLAVVRERAAGVEVGLFGPDSVTWRIDREAITFLGAGRALLLQLAHPWVAAGVAQHSRSFADPIGRFHRTFQVVFSMVFGTTEQALVMARRLHRRHESITGVLPRTVGPFPAGSAYWANEVGALRWVHATLMETALMVHELAFPPLSPADRARYIEESKLFARLFGIPPSAMPADWDEFAIYCRTMHDSPLLTVDDQARALAREIFSRPIGPVSIPRWYRHVTAHLLPPRLRAAFGFAYGPAERDTALRALDRARRLYARLPDRLRYVGPYQEASARLAGRRHPDRFTQLLNRVWIGRPGLGG